MMGYKIIPPVPGAQPAGGDPDPFSRRSQVSNVSLFESGAGASVTATLPSVVVGDLIWVVVRASEAAEPTITVSDPTNGSYTAGDKLYDATNDNVFQQFYFKNSAAGTNLVITANFSPNCTERAIYAAAWDGVDQAVGVDVQAGQIQGVTSSGTDVISSSSDTTTQACLILGAFNAYDGGGVTFASGTGFTGDLENEILGGGGAEKWSFEHLEQGGAGSAEVLGSITAAGGGDVDWTLCLLFAARP